MVLELDKWSISLSQFYFKKLKSVINKTFLDGSVTILTTFLLFKDNYFISKKSNLSYFLIFTF